MTRGGLAASFVLVAACALLVALVAVDVREGVLAGGVLIAVWVVVAVWSFFSQRVL